MNQADIKRFIIASPRRDGFIVKHNIPGEAIICEVPTLEIAGTIVKALRERQYLKHAAEVLAKHIARNERRVRRGERTSLKTYTEGGVAFGKKGKGK